MAGGLGLRNRHRAWFQVEESLRVSTRGGSDVAPAPLRGGVTDCGYVDSDERTEDPLHPRVAGLVGSRRPMRSGRRPSGARDAELLH